MQPFPQGEAGKFGREIAGRARAEILWPIFRDVTFSSVIYANMSETSLLQDTWETFAVLFCQGSDVCEILHTSLACKSLEAA